MHRSTPRDTFVRLSIECHKQPETDRGNSDPGSQSHRAEATEARHHRESVSATPVDSLRRLRVPGCGAAQPSERALSCAPLCADVLAEFVAFVRLACPSHLHRPATSLRFAPFQACFWGSAWSALANSSHDVSHRRTASGHCSLGVNRFGRTHTSSRASYRERNRSRKHPERTNGTPRSVSVFVHSHEAFGAQSLKEHSLERNASEARSSGSVLSTVLSSVRQKPNGTRERNAGSKKPSTEHQWVVNQASTKHQPVIN